MAGPIKREQVFNKNVFTDPEEEAKKLNIALDVTEKKLKAILDLTEKKLKDFKIGDTKDIKKFNEALEDSKDAVKDLNDFTEERIAIQKELEIIEKKRLQTAAKLAVANTEEAKALAVANLRLQERNKAIKEAAKDSLGLISAYAKESKRLNDLRGEYKDLAIQNKENTKEGKKLLKNIVLLDKKLKDLDDSVGQNFRSVGKYEKALKGLNSIITKLGALALITKGVELLTGAFNASREGALETNKVLANFIQTAQVLINNFIKAFSGIGDLFGAISDTIESHVTSIIVSFFKVEQAIGGARLALLKWTRRDTAEAQKSVDDLDKKIEFLNKRLVELDKSSIADSISKIASAFDDTGETVLRAIKGQKEFLELELRLKIAIEQETRALAGLQEQRQILQDISDDDTIGFVTRAKAVKRAQKAAEDFAKQDVLLAKLKEKLTIEAVKQDLRAANALSERRLDEITTGEQLKAVLLDAALGRKISDANDAAFSAAFVERREKEVEALSFRRDQEEKFRKTERDAFEQENDILVEFTEQRIAANETIINSDKATLKERRNALAENQKLEKELFENSINLILEQGKASIDILKTTIDLRTDLTESQKEEEKALLDKRKALLTNIAIQEILNEQDIVKQGILIRNLD